MPLRLPSRPPSPSVIFGTCPRHSHVPSQGVPLPRDGSNPCPGAVRFTNNDKKRNGSLTIAGRNAKVEHEEGDDDDDDDDEADDD